MLHHKEKSEGGEFLRQEDQFRSWVEKGGSSKFPIASGRYHLYVSLACPWAHRTIIVRKLKKLENVIGMTVVDPIRDERGWGFTEKKDPINGFEYLGQAYDFSDSRYEARVTVPVLWDIKTSQIVSNCDDDIMRMLNSTFDDFTDSNLDLYPVELRSEIDEINDLIYSNVNDGVYRSGFAKTQNAYEAAVHKLFKTLDLLESRLSEHRYLTGNRLTEADWRLFPTLIRFDAVYHGHFKCNLKRIIDYPNLYGYMCDLYHHNGIAETVDFDHIKRHYYMTHPEINPTKIVPVGPNFKFDAPHNRARLSND
ncbi:glutathione-dependent reductase [Candidatus Poribacteria bacterium]|nr:glutathione-dependent reductase [Candidatus Poribacteria bacterium]